MVLASGNRPAFKPQLMRCAIESLGKDPRTAAHANTDTIDDDDDDDDGDDGDDDNRNLLAKSGAR